MLGTSVVRGPIGEEVTAGLALDVGRALATDGATTVVIGRDARDSSRMLSRALVVGLTGCGANVVDIGVESTPTVARAVAHEGADAGVVVTASHNSAPDNGLKLWAESGRAFDGERNDRIAEIVEAESFAFAELAGEEHATLGISLPIPDVSVVEPLVANVSRQPFAYHVANDTGRSIDKPRNLAERVTIE